ncbi:MAG: Glycosyltransferase [uncultured Sphingomonas sp.]|uniref:Glycosyltransferase n=1 Tax=uncultured Sphingomonas sp. TaxID=158754 RepID=A0A6J4TJK2_9SPHN|nr:MAG: Glycosyltransferase [uncultured Sphingomonas sp.]
MSRLRLFLTTDAVGGVWTYSLDLAAALAAEVDAVVILAVLGPAPNADQLTRAAAVPGLQLIHTGLPLDWTATSSEELRASAETLADLADQADAEVVQLHSPALAVGTYRAPVVTVVHSCVATWWSAVKTGPLPDDFAWRMAIAREGLRRSELVVTPSRAFAETVQQAYGLKHPPAAVHNGRFHPAAGASSSGSFAFTAGRLWDEGKNVAAFDAAAALSAVPFKAAGPVQGPNGARVDVRSAELLGFLAEEDLTATLAQQPIFVSAAKYEPFGLSVLEAAQAGCALVLSPIPTFRELWSGAALFADGAEEIAAAVDRLAADPSERAALGAAAKARSERFTPAAMATTMLGHYRALLGSERRAAA